MFDAILLWAVKFGSENAFEKIIDKHNAYVCAVVCNTVKNFISGEDAEKISSDVFLSFWENAHQVHKLKPWLGSVAWTKALSKLHKVHDDIDKLTNINAAQSATRVKALTAKKMQKAAVCRAVPPYAIIRRFIVIAAAFAAVLAIALSFAAAALILEDSGNSANPSLEVVIEDDFADRPKPVNLAQPDRLVHVHLFTVIAAALAITLLLAAAALIVGRKVRSDKLSRGEVDEDSFEQASKFVNLSGADNGPMTLNAHYIDQKELGFDFTLSGAGVQDGFFFVFPGKFSLSVKNEKGEKDEKNCGADNAAAYADDEQYSGSSGGFSGNSGYYGDFLFDINAIRAGEDVYNISLVFRWPEAVPAGKTVHLRLHGISFVYQKPDADESDPAVIMLPINATADDGWFFIIDIADVPST